MRAHTHTHTRTHTHTHTHTHTQARACYSASSSIPTLHDVHATLCYVSVHMCVQATILHYDRLKPAEEVTYVSVTS